jgi:hypothetical protein
MENWKTIASFTFPTEAHIAKGYLESNGIETIMKDEMTVQVNNFYSNAIGGVKILVQNSDYEQGIHLLQKGGYLLGNDATTDYKIELVEKDSLFNKKTCPFCNSENIGRNKKINILIVPVYLILGVIFPIYKLSYKCFDCWKEWKFKISKNAV